MEANANFITTDDNRCLAHVFDVVMTVSITPQYTAHTHTEINLIILIIGTNNLEDALNTQMLNEDDDGEPCGFGCERSIMSRVPCDRAPQLEQNQFLTSLEKKDGRGSK